MGTQPGNNGTLCVYGGAEMTSQDELRDRLSDVIDRALSAWMTVDDALDGTDEGSEQDFVAQAVIDEFGLTVEERIDEPGKRGINPVRRIVGEWEKQ